MYTGPVRFTDHLRAAPLFAVFAAAICASPRGLVRTGAGVECGLRRVIEIKAEGAGYVQRRGTGMSAMGGICVRPAPRFSRRAAVSMVVLSVVVAFAAALAFNVFRLTAGSAGDASTASGQATASPPPAAAAQAAVSRSLAGDRSDLLAIRTATGAVVFRNAFQGVRASLSGGRFALSGPDGLQVGLSSAGLGRDGRDQSRAGARRCLAAPERRHVLVVAGQRVVCEPPVGDRAGFHDRSPPRRARRASDLSGCLR